MKLLFEFGPSALLASLAASQTMGFILWSGLGLLTLSLLVLMRTRWGQAQPLAKCVVLSVFAHILFIAYAYGTRLMFDVPPQRAEQVLRLAFVSVEHEQTTAPQPRQDWDQFPAEMALTPDVSSPPQLPVDVTADLPSAAEPPDFSVTNREPEMSLLSQQADMPKLGTAQPERFLPVEPSDLIVERPVAEPSSEELPVTPAMESPERMASESPARADSPEQVPSPVEMAMDREALQRLTEIDFTADIAKAAAAAADQLAAASNRASDAFQTQVAERADMGLLAVDPRLAASRFASPTSPPGAARRLGDGALLPQAYQSRMSRNRLTLIEEQGGNQHTEEAVESALAWLAANQSPDGRWEAGRFGAGRETQVLGHDRKGAGLDADTGISGLALLAFLAAGHTHFEGEYRRTVQHGLEFLLAQQAADGNLAGAATLYSRMYCHGMASLAISEASAMTGDHRLRGSVERAVQYTLAAQDRNGGGWRYQPADQGDMSQFGWQVMALKSAELAGVPIPLESRAGMLRFIRSVSKGEHQGLASYRPTERASPTMTAEALTCRIFLNAGLNELSLAEATAYLLREPPLDGQPNLYYWYYATLALHQIQGDSWRIWNHALQQRLLALQERTGSDAGSFSPYTVWGSYGGRVYSTAMAALCLEVYYRYLPVYERTVVPPMATRTFPVDPRLR